MYERKLKIIKNILRFTWFKEYWFHSFNPKTINGNLYVGMKENYVIIIYLIQ